MADIVPQERFLGCLLGEAVGDALGAPYEGAPADFISKTFGPLHELLNKPIKGSICYTDDTQMMIGVAEILLAHGEIRETALAQQFAANYDPERGYGPGTCQILQELIEGGDWQNLAETIFPGGSFGNGAAMRVAPVGLLFAHDLDRVAEQARLSALPTHRHPWGIEGARLLAMAVALASRGPPLDRSDFYDQLERYCESDEFAWQLRAARELRSGDSLKFLGSSLPAHRSVVTSIACFTTALDSYEQVVIKAISLGDDTDTLAAMAGALSGAYLGCAGIPDRWTEHLEDGPQGLSYLRYLATKLHERYLAPAD